MKVLNAEVKSIALRTAWTPARTGLVGELSAQGDVE
jgi:hypothetical protein